MDPNVLTLPTYWPDPCNIRATHEIRAHDECWYNRAG